MPAFSATFADDKCFSVVVGTHCIYLHTLIKANNSLSRGPFGNKFGGPEVQLTPIFQRSCRASLHLILLPHNNLQLKHYRKFFFVSVFVLNVSDEKRTASNAERGLWAPPSGFKLPASGLRPSS